MKILCYGSLNIDRVYQVEHFVREGETIRSLKMKTFCGGKGLNQSIALAKAGAQVFHAGKVGADGAVLLEELKKNGVDSTHTRTTEEVPTGHAIIQVDKNGQNCIIIHAGANEAITRDEVDQALKNFVRGDILLLQNEINQLEYIIEQANEKGMSIALNPSPISHKLATSKLLNCVDLFLLNEVEGCELTGKTQGREICEALKVRYPRCTVVLTLGKQGCLHYDGKKFTSHGIYDVPVVDTTAAGDTFTGYFLTCFSEGWSVSDALLLASKASSLAVSKAGAAGSIPTRSEAIGADLTLTLGSVHST